MKRIAPLCAALLLAAAFPAHAMSGANARFGSADTDKDGFLDSGEFTAAFAALKPEAFGLIDADKDGRIAAGEWRAFLSGHGGPSRRASPEPAGRPPVTPQKGGLPVLAPPGK